MKEKMNMRKIINKKIYDTDKATLVCSNKYNEDIDFICQNIGLYITKKNNWFLCYEGDQCGEDTLNNIIPITEEEAYDWLEERDKTEAIEQYFSDILEEA